MTTFNLTSAATGTSIQAAGFFDWANNILSNTQALLGALLIVVGLLIFIITSWQTKTIPGIIGGLVAGAIVAGAGTIIIALSGVFSQTVQEGNTTASPATVYSQQHTGNELA